jgi:phosphopantothenoylcysteine decarboxylase/phosphopantothenate--cysteine ligase
MGAETVLVSGPVSLTVPQGAQTLPVGTAREMLAACEGELPCDIAIFAAETSDVLAHAEAKLARKGCDLIVANDVSPGSGVMGGEENLVHLVTAQGVESWPDLPKRAVAARLMARLAAELGDAR